MLYQHQLHFLKCPNSSPPLVTGIQIDTGKNVLQLDDIVLTLTPSKIAIAPTPTSFSLQSQHVAFKVLHKSSSPKVSLFLENVSISNMLKNGAT